jgi:hypothetical protein
MKACLFFILTFVSGVSYSQKWFFRVKPITGSPLASFQRFEKAVYDPIITYSNGIKPSYASLMDNVYLRLQYNLELFADFYQINPKWNIGVGFGVYNGARTFLKTSYSEIPQHIVIDEEIFEVNGLSSFTSINGPVDFNTYFLLTRKTKVKLKNHQNSAHNFSFGAGFTKNKKNDHAVNDTYFGLWVYETYKSHNYFPFLLFRYELAFLSKTGNNLFNISINYQQGIYKIVKFTHYDIYNNGPIDYQQSFSRGSSIGVSISKPFYIKRPK